MSPISHSSRTTNLSAPALMLFVSGAAALIYQILWVRQLSLVVGIDVYAVTIAVSAFFAGLAIGNYLFGRYSERFQRPLRLYGMVELTIGGTGLLSTWILTLTPAWFVVLENTVGVAAWGLPLALVGLPAIFMGGTLPILIKVVTGEEAQLGSHGGRLYAANTLGAILGTLTTAYFLIPAFGIFGSAIWAAGMNLLSAGIAFNSSRSAAINAPVIQKRLAPANATSDWKPALLYGIAGGIALGYEVVWSQMIIPWTSTRSFAFATVLAVYLTGLALGSLWGARRAARNRDIWGEFGLLIAGAGAIALLQMLTLGDWLDRLQVRAATTAFNTTGNEYIAMSCRFGAAAGCVLFIPALLLGAAFPLALRLEPATARSGEESGRMLAANTAGGIIGTLVTGFLMIPAWGVERALLSLAISAAVLGLVAVLYATKKYRWIVRGIGFLIAFAAFQVDPNQFANLLATRHQGRAISHTAGTGGTVAVIEQGKPGRNFRRLYIQGVSNTGDSLTSLRYMRLQALLPLIVQQDQPKSALVIGLGTGITAGSLLKYEGLERRVCAELLPEVVAASQYFSGNQNAASDARLEIRRTDGRHELLKRDDTYDLITLEPPPPSAAGVANLYSTEFYKLAATRLTQHGLVAQWLPLPTQNIQDTRSLVRSFLEVFPEATLWTTELHEMLLLGSLEPMQLDVHSIRARYSQHGVQESLTQVGIASPAALLATYVCGRAGLEAFSKDALPVTDDRPRIEYGPWTTGNEFLVTIRALLEQQTDPVLRNADEQFRAAVAAERKTLHRFYEASFHAYSQNRTEWHNALEDALRADPNNAYYRWFGGTKP